MFKVKVKDDGRVFTVYGVKTVDVYTGVMTYFLIYLNEGWHWCDANNFAPYKE